MEEEEGVILSRHLDEVVLDFVQQGDPAVMTSLLKQLRHASDSHPSSFYLIESIGFRRPSDMI